MANLPIDVRALIKTGSKLLEQRDLPVRIAVLVELDAPDSLVDAVRDAFRPRTGKALVEVEAVEPGSVATVEPSVDAAVALIGGVGSGVTATLEDLRRRAIPTAAIAVREFPDGLAALLGHPDEDVISGVDPAEMVRGPLADWVVRRLPDKRTAIASNFEFVRSAIAREAVKATAWQNAVIGGVAIIPGADMPLMTLNQGKMLLQIAAAYGQQLGAERVKELAAVVGGGLLFRSLARQALTVVPGLGWAIKAGIGYSGTVAMGTAAIAYFEKGADIPEMLAGLKETAGKAAITTRQRLKLGPPK